MKQLIVFRHAKSDWDDPVARDFDRPLNARGMTAARVMGQYAASRGLVFDHILASPAVRCAETLDAFFDGLGRTAEPDWDRRIYLASSATLLDVIRETPNSVNSLLMIGHNPGLEDLILEVVTDTSSPLRQSVEAKFPTASIAVLQFATDDWADVGTVPAAFVSFTRPRDLDPALGPQEEEY